jgi:hypothetical protein
VRRGQRRVDWDCEGEDRVLLREDCLQVKILSTEKKKETNP